MCYKVAVEFYWILSFVYFDKREKYLKLFSVFFNGKC